MQCGLVGFVDFYVVCFYQQFYYGQQVLVGGYYQCVFVGSVGVFEIDVFGVDECFGYFDVFVFECVD